MQRAENKRNLGAVIAHRVLARLDNGIQPAVQLRVLVATGQEALQVNLGAVGLAAGHIPVRGKGGNAADAVDFPHRFPHAPAVFLRRQIALARRLHHVQTNHARIVPRQGINVRMMPFAILRREGHIQPALLAKEDTLLILQVVQ